MPISPICTCTTSGVSVIATVDATGHKRRDTAQVFLIRLVTILQWVGTQVWRMTLGNTGVSTKSELAKEKMRSPPRWRKVWSCPKGPTVIGIELLLSPENVGAFSKVEPRRAFASI